jgi:hypothetical protein
MHNNKIYYPAGHPKNTNGAAWPKETLITPATKSNPAKPTNLPTSSWHPKVTPTGWSGPEPKPWSNWDLSPPEWHEDFDPAVHSLNYTMSNQERNQYRAHLTTLREELPNLDTQLDAPIIHGYQGKDQKNKKNPFAKWVPNNDRTPTPKPALVTIS